MKRLDGACNYSIKLLMASLLIGVFVPFALFSLVNNLYTRDFAQRQLIQSYTDSMKLFLRVVEDTYKKVELELGAMINQNLSDMFAAEADGNSNETLLARQRLKRVFEQNALLSGSFDAVFLYNRTTNRYMDMVYITMPDAEKQAVRKSLEAGLAADAENTGRWHIRDVDGVYYITRILRINDSFLGVYINVDRQLALLHAQAFIAMDDAVFLDQEYRVISGKLLGEAVEGDMVLADREYRLGGVNYYLVHVPLAKTDLILTSLIRLDTMMAPLNRFRGVWVALLAGMLALTPLLYWLISRFILRPLAEVTGALQAFTRGDFSTRVRERTPIRELGIVGRTFNAMANEVTELKIQNYESKLEKQRIELQYYQLQIRPHFLLNTLNMIATLAQARRYELILDLSLFLAAYFRFLLMEKGTFVCLKDELRHVANYLQIQQLRYPDKLNVEMSIEAGHERAAVLPLLIQTFVENSIQFAVNMDAVTWLFVGARMIEDGRLELTVEDDGPGYPGWMIGGGEADAGEKGHIGIHNVRERLLLAYGERAELSINNRNQGGATARIVIPYEEC